MEHGVRDPLSRLLMTTLLYERRSALMSLQYWIELDVELVMGSRWMCARMLRFLAFPYLAGRPSSTWAWIVIIRSVT